MFITENRAIQNFFEEKAFFFEGQKNERLHFIVNADIAKIIREESEKLDVSYSNYILYTALSFNIDDIYAKLDEIFEKINILAKEKRNAFSLDYSQMQKKNSSASTNSIQKKDNIKENVSNNRSHFHLRVTQICHDEIIRRACAYSMSIGEYITFILLHPHLLEISKKIDAANKKLDLINGKNDNSVFT